MAWARWIRSRLSRCRRFCAWSDCSRALSRPGEPRRWIQSRPCANRDRLGVRLGLSRRADGLRDLLTELVSRNEAAGALRQHDADNAARRIDPRHGAIRAGVMVAAVRKEHPAKAVRAGLADLRARHEHGFHTLFLQQAGAVVAAAAPEHLEKTPGVRS